MYFESSDIIHIDNEAYDVEYGCKVAITWERGNKAEVHPITTIMKVGEIPFLWLSEEAQKKVNSAFAPDIVWEIKDRYGLAA